jgi:tetratricopeptide (TPR) repeat protein
VSFPPAGLALVALAAAVVWWRARSREGTVSRPRPRPRPRRASLRRVETGPPTGTTAHAHRPSPCDHVEIDAHEELAIARDALAQGDVKHAAHHVAGALAADWDAPETLELLEKIVKNADDALSLTTPDAGGALYYGSAAVRAFVLERGNRLGEALELIAGVAASQPEAPCLSWAERWIARPHGRAALAGRGDAFARPFGSWVRENPGRPLLERALLVLEKAAEADPEAEQPPYVAGMILRRIGRLDDALQVANAAFTRKPSWVSATALAQAHRKLGHVDQALAAYERALELDPDDLTARLDIGDMLLDARRLEESLRAYEDVLAVEPRHPWALPSTCFLQAKFFSGEPTWRADLERLAGDGNERAQSCLEALDAIPFVTYLPEPADVSVKCWRKVLATVDPEKAQTLALKIDGVEAPSTSLVADLVRARFPKLVVKVEVTKVATPDPRLPRGRVEWLLWRFNGTMPEVAVPGPAPAVAVAIGSLTRTDFSVERWWAQAGRVAREIGPAGLDDVLRTMVHPPAPDAKIEPWNWVQRAQIAAALVVARIDRGWEGSLRRRALLSLLHGPADWTVGAAAVALAEVARETSEAAPEVRAAFDAALEQAPRTFVAHLEALVESALRLPGLHGDERARWLRARRAIAAS